MRMRFGTYLPLVLFTGLFPVAVGLLLPAAVVLCLPGVVPLPAGEERTVLKIGSAAHRALDFVMPAAAIAVPALLVAGLHLGRKLRAPLAARRFGRSLLSTEVVLAAAFVALAFFAGPVTLFLEVEMATRVKLGLAALAGVGAVAALARIYALPGQAGWRGLAGAAGSPVTMALAAALVGWATAGAGHRPAATVALAAALLADAALAAVRTGRLVRALRRGDPGLAHPRAARLAVGFAPGRFAAVAALAVIPVTADPAELVMAGSPVPGAIAILIAGSLLDRFGFYAGAVRASPRIAVEGLRRDRLARAAGARAPGQPCVGK